MDAAHLRAAFPVLDETAYLNAGTCGPLPAAAQRAALDAWRYATETGRSTAFYGRLVPLAEDLRTRYAELLGAASPDHLALTAGTSDGCAHVIGNVGLQPGDVVVTAEDEHPGVTGPLIAAREQRGVVLKIVPAAEVPDAIGEDTKLVAVSHVSWHSGAVAPVAEIAARAKAYNIPVLLDGAQGVGAIRVDVRSLGVQFYAGSGQKWLCGPVGCGMLWIDPEWNERLTSPGPSYGGLTDPNAGFASELVDTARRHDTPLPDLPQVAGAVAALDVLGELGFAELHARAVAGAAELADALRAAGHDVVPRGDSTLVAWNVASDDEAIATRERLEASGIVIRDLPGAARLRAAFGAWNDADDAERLLTALGTAA